jgi:uncharacterized protein YndB with AHSA1/START domain
MPADGHAVLRQQDGKHALVFERMLAHPPVRVWQALVRHDELAHWHPTPFELDAATPEAGDRVRYRRVPGGPEIEDGRLLEYAPPHLLAYTWGEDRLRWELREDGDGCLLRLTHVFEDRFKAARDAAGWHLCLDALTCSLQGRPRAQRGVLPRPPEGWSELNSDYRQRFGIAAGDATPPPS